MLDQVRHDCGTLDSRVKCFITYNQDNKPNHLSAISYQLMWAISPAKVRGEYGLITAVHIAIAIKVAFAYPCNLYLYGGGIFWACPKSKKSNLWNNNLIGVTFCQTCLIVKPAVLKGIAP